MKTLSEHERCNKECMNSEDWKKVEKSVTISSERSSKQSAGEDVSGVISGDISGEASIEEPSQIPDEAFKGKDMNDGGVSIAENDGDGPPLEVDNYEKNYNDMDERKGEDLEK